MRTTVDAVAEFLAVAGIQRMYGVPGTGSSLDVIEATAPQRDRVCFDPSSGSRDSMAATDGDLSDRPGVRLVPQGSGLAGAVSALALAHLDRAPLIALSECPPRFGRCAGAGRVLDHPHRPPRRDEGRSDHHQHARQQLIAWAWEKGSPPPRPVRSSWSCRGDQALRSDQGPSPCPNVNLWGLRQMPSENCPPADPRGAGRGRRRHGVPGTEAWPPPFGISWNTSAHRSLLPSGPKG